MAGHIVPDHTGPMTHASSSPHLQSCTLQMKISEKKDPAHTDRRRPNVTAHSNPPDHHNILPALDSSIGPVHRLPPFDLHYYPADEFSRTDRKSTRLNSSHVAISYAVFCLKEKTAGGS